MALAENNRPNGCRVRTFHHPSNLKRNLRKFPGKPPRLTPANRKRHLYPVSHTSWELMDERGKGLVPASQDYQSYPLYRTGYQNLGPYLPRAYEYDHHSSYYTGSDKHTGSSSYL